MASGAAGSRAWRVDEVRFRRSLGLGFVLVAVSEFRRAIAAEQRYHDLRHNKRPRTDWAWT